MSDNERNWRIVRTEDGPDYRIFRVRLTTAVSPRTNQEGRYVVLDNPDFVNVVALNSEGQIVLVRQYRHGINQVSLEIPSGLVDAGEEPLAAAQRELAEETGYTGEHWVHLGRTRPNAAFMNNWCHHFLVKDIRLTTQPHLDPGEDVKVELYPFEAIPTMIVDGTITQALVLSAVYWLEHTQQ